VAAPTTEGAMAPRGADLSGHRTEGRRTFGVRRFLCLRYR